MNDTNHQKLLLKISYHGAHFQGWQTQPNGNGVEDKIKIALKTLYNEEIKIHSASRTDSGVHAKEQLATIQVKNKIVVEKLLRSLNALTPPQLSILEIIPTENDFNLRKQIRGKKYCYQIYNSPTPPALFADYYWYVPQKLNFSKMKKAAQVLEGTHDFQAFRSSSCESKNTKKTIFSIQWEKHFLQPANLISIFFEGSGFLKQMIRIIVGSLVEIGLEKQTTTLFSEVLKNGNTESLKFTAPAKGLFLEKILVDYPKI